MNIILWIAQSLIAAMFFAGGLFKILTPKEKLISGQPYVKGYSSLQLKLIGTAEVAGAVGLVVPYALDVLPILTPLAAVGLCTIMALASRIHLHRNENGKVAIIVVMLIITAFIAFQRI